MNAKVTSKARAAVVVGAIVTAVLGGTAVSAEAKPKLNNSALCQSLLEDFNNSLQNAAWAHRAGNEKEATNWLRLAHGILDDALDNSCSWASRVKQIVVGHHSIGGTVPGPVASLPGAGPTPGPVFRPPTAPVGAVAAL
jgi:hypothetical protein